MHRQDREARRLGMPMDQVGIRGLEHETVEARRKARDLRTGCAVLAKAEQLQIVGREHREVVDRAQSVMAAGTAQVELATPDAVAAEFGEAAAEPAGRAEYMAALGVRVRTLRDAAQRLRAVPGVRAEPQRLVVPAVAAFNTTIVFSE